MNQAPHDWPTEPGSYLLYPQAPDAEPSLYILLLDGRWWHPQCDPENTVEAADLGASYCSAERYVPVAIHD